MPDWLQALRQLRGTGTASVLITVVDAQGSTPRAAGARMVVTRDNQFDTIGGGHLELRAIDMARTILSAAELPCTPQLHPQLHRFPLGPALGQCCGGAVQLLFEKIDAGSDAMIDAWAGFAKTGKPAPTAIGPWPVYDPKRDNYQSIDVAMSSNKDNYGDRNNCAFWDKIAAY